MAQKIRLVVSYLLCIVVFVFVFQFILADHISLKWPDMRYTLLVCLAIASFVNLYKHPRDVAISLFVPAALSAAIAPKLLFLSKDVKIFGNMIWSELGFFLFAYLLINLLHYLLYNFLKYRKSVAVFITILKIILTMYPITFISYFIAIRDILDTVSVIAVYQTNIQESKEFLLGIISPSIAILIIVTAVIVSWLFWQSTRSVEFHSLGQRKCSTLVVFILLWLTPLKITDCYVKKIVDNSQEYLQSVRNFRSYRYNSDGTPKIIPATTSLSGDNQTFILVLGESQARDHMNAYGYKRNTTPWLTPKRLDPNFIFFENAYSSHTLTMKVLSMALTEANQYNKRDFAETYSIIDIAKAAGFKTVWLSNQAKYGNFSTPTTVISDMCDQQIWVNTEADFSNKFDEYLLKYLPELPKQGRNLVVIHLSGSHYEYKDRYPDEYRKFDNSDDLPLTDIKSVQKVNEYDNSVLYTDYVLSKIYEYAESNKNVAGIMYLSDHGEDAFADNKHIVGLFRFRMSRIPLFIYLSSEYQRNNKDILNNLLHNRQMYFSNDFVYDTILNILKIDQKFYEPYNSLASDKYNYQPSDLTTLNGQIKLSDDNKKE